MTFEETMRAARLYREIGYTELAVRMGRKRVTYSRYLSQVEHGQLHPSYDTIGQIAEGLDVELYYRPKQGWGWRPVR